MVAVAKKMFQQSFQLASHGGLVPFTARCAGLKPSQPIAAMHLAWEGGF